MEMFASMFATMKIILITDIGRDIDDTLCLLALQPYLSDGRAELVGVVGSGGNSELRAAVARGWLRIFGYQDEQIPVMAGTARGVGGCYVPTGFPTPEQASLGTGNGSDFILDCAREYQDELFILVIAPMTPLADAVDKDDNGVLKKIGAVYVQGQAEIDDDGRLTPDSRAFNLREDMPSATKVFDALQDSVPFRLLGKHTAYAVKLGHKHFNLWS
eukprot:5566000-Pyramimonas_sp.AAC.1